MKKESLLIALEILWLALTALVVWMVLWPIHNAMRVWPFEAWNIVFIVSLITLARYVFLLEHTFLAKRQALKIVLMLAMAPLTFIFIDGLNHFITGIDEQGWAGITGHLPTEQKLSMEKYLWNEMLFFGMGSIITAIVFAGRMMLSVWRLRNRGKA